MLRRFAPWRVAVPQQPTGNDRKVVIVVEDEPAIGELIAGAISDEPGYYAVLITDPTKALETTKHIAPDVMVLDIRLPGMSGFELYDRLRSDARTQKIPVLFETANGAENAAEFRKRGIATYVEKPFDLWAVVGIAIAEDDVRRLEREEIRAACSLGHDLARRGREVALHVFELFDVALRV